MGEEVVSSQELQGGGPSSFTDLNLSEVMHRALDKIGFKVPSPVQSSVIPLALACKDFVAQAQTGTGKTAAFAIPILEQLSTQKESKTPQALIVVPTRELAVQVTNEFRKLAFGRKVECLALYGGDKFKDQVRKLNRFPEVIVGTPGRLLDHLKRETLSLKNLRWIILDEADRMLDIGFRPDIERILKRCPKKRCTWLLSATMPQWIERLSKRYMNHPEKLDLTVDAPAHDTIDQFYFTVDEEKKFELLLKLIDREHLSQAIIFCQTKRKTEHIQRALSKEVAESACIHGDMIQSGRNRVMKKFRQKQVRYLVATDVVGRGIDVSSISHIINYDLPQDTEDYVHRVGRTGRMGKDGVAYTFVTLEEGTKLTQIEKHIGKLLVQDSFPDFEAVKKPEPRSEEALKRINALSKRPRKRHRRAL